VREHEPADEARSGAEAFYRQAAQDYGVALERLAYAYEADADQRRDLLQEIHLALWRSFDKFDGHCSLRTWVYRVAHNVATSHVIRQRRRNTPTFITLDEAENETKDEDAGVSADRARARALLLAFIQRLEPPDRQLMLAYLEGMDAETIGEITGLSTANVWTRIHRIKNVLIRKFHTGGHYAR
jgi:RNA polymerase sigma-70 factor (ECF subfamily)